MQENGDFFAIFSLENGWRRYSLEAKILGGGTLRTRLMFFFGNLNKKHFLEARSCAAVRSVVSRSSLGGRGQGIRGVNEKVNLKKSAFLRKRKLCR